MLCGPEPGRPAARPRGRGVRRRARGLPRGWGRVPLAGRARGRGGAGGQALGPSVRRPLISVTPNCWGSRSPADVPRAGAALPREHLAESAGFAFGPAAALGGGVPGRGPGQPWCKSVARNFTE